MTPRKISPKVQQATRKYVDSLGTSPDQLTDAQWRMITNYVRVQRMALPMLLALGLICAGISFWGFGLSKKELQTHPQSNLGASE